MSKALELLKLMEDSKDEDELIQETLKHFKSLSGMGTNFTFDCLFNFLERMALELRKKKDAVTEAAPFVTKVEALKEELQKLIQKINDLKEEASQQLRTFEENGYKIKESEENDSEEIIQ